MLHVDSELSVITAYYKTPGHIHVDVQWLYKFQCLPNSCKMNHCDSQKTCRNCLMAVNAMCRNCSRIDTGIGDSSWESLKYTNLYNGKQ